MRSTQTTTRTRNDKALAAHVALKELLGVVARQGYYGAATLTLQMQDGHLQSVRLTTEKQIKV